MHPSISESALSSNPDLLVSKQDSELVVLMAMLMKEGERLSPVQRVVVSLREVLGN